MPILVFVATLLGIDYGNLGDMGAAMILWLAIGTALVGFSEEIAYRGLAVVGFRGGYGEVRVWLFTSLLFGLLHGVNVILGQGAVLTVRQVVFAFVLGSVFYAIRRISGTIVVAMVVHALWDFGTFSHVAGTSAGAAAAQTDIATAGAGALQPLLVLVAIILVIVGAKRILGASAPGVCASVGSPLPVAAAGHPPRLPRPGRVPLPPFAGLRALFAAPAQSLTPQPGSRGLPCTTSLGDEREAHSPWGPLWFQKRRSGSASRSAVRGSG